LLFAALTLALGRPAPAATITIDFENLPSLSPQPNNFFAAGPIQTYTDPGVFSITGGVVLGNPLLLPAFPLHGTPPNLYGTTDIADPSLLSTITLTFPSAEGVTSVSGVLFNGQPIAENYVVDAFSGAIPVAANTFTNMPDSTSTSAFGNFSLTSTTALPITSVTIPTPADAAVNGWDFLVDTIVITTNPVVVPAPVIGHGLPVLLAVAGIFLGAKLSQRSKKRRSLGTAMPLRQRLLRSQISGGFCSFMLSRLVPIVNSAN
jgi:hypothetical protein